VRRPAGWAARERCLLWGHVSAAALRRRGCSFGFLAGSWSSSTTSVLSLFMSGRQWVAGIVVLVTLAVMLWLFSRMRREG
jgi:hypothetical protein